MPTLTCALAQINPTVGDIDGNVERILEARENAKAQGAELVIYSEMVVTGYPLEDLVLKPALMAASDAAVQRLCAATTDGGPAMIIGAPRRPHDPSNPDQRPLNCALVLVNGEIVSEIAKHVLPNYGVFDEKRVFAQGPIPGPVSFPLKDQTTIRLGVMVCEDMWVEDVAEALEESGAELLIVINGSPYEVAKQDIRIQKAVARVTETGLPLIYVNQLGGQDELVFEGGSFALENDCQLACQLPMFEPSITLMRWERLAGDVWASDGNACRLAPPERLEAIYRAMVLGLRDYVTKNRFPGVVLGLSGGIDSAISAAVAVDALGADAVHCVMMPSRYTSQESLDDAKSCAALLGVKLDEIAIEPAVGAFATMLGPVLAGRAADTTEENIQSRIRGVLLMAISNKLGPMLVTTGNKSEMSVGYATLYGDMCGGYSVLKDVYKSTLFELCHWRNQNCPADALGPDGPVMPERVITKPPSAELRADQKDEDSLPLYDVLDTILRGLIEQDRSPADLVANGHDPVDVRRASSLLDLAEYKRRQAPPGVKITEKSFGRDRRYPITNHFRRIGLAQITTEGDN